MNYILTPSLKTIALVKIAATLWNQEDIRTLISKFNFPLLGSERREKWQDIENKVIEKVPQLSQPESLKEELLCFLQPIGLQILKWKEYHDENSYICISLPNELCWTPQGTVDRKKTAEVLIKDESLDIAARYKLACIYCFESDILGLWHEMPEICRKFFYSEEHPIEVKQQELVVLWTYDIKGKMAMMENFIERRWHRICTPYQYAFEYAADGGNKAATEYFLQKLTAVERKESVVRSTVNVLYRRCISNRERIDLPKELYADVLCFLLPQMDEEEQIEVFKKFPYEVLKCLLDWPWQRLFLKTANRMWDFLSEYDYALLLSVIVDKIIVGFKDCDYQQLLRILWQQSSHIYKNYIIAQCVSGGFLLSDLFKIEDKETIRLILKYASVREKEEIIFSNREKNICENLIRSNKWDSLKFFVRECISSEDILIKFKEEFKRRVKSSFSKKKLDREKRIWTRFFQLLDDIIHKDYKKRSVEGENSLRLHSTEL